MSYCEKRLERIKKYQKEYNQRPEIKEKKTDREECKHCEGKGYIEYTYKVDEDLSKTD